MPDLTLLLAADETRTVRAILAQSALCAERGIFLTPADAASIAHTHIRALADNRLVEVGSGSVERIIAEFSRSPYADRNTFASLAETMSEAFCYLKRESEKELRDGELIAAMRAVFDRTSQGSAELFLGRDLDRLRDILKEKNSRRSLLAYLLEENTPEFMEAPTVGDRGDILREYFADRYDTEAEVWEEDRHERHRTF